MYTYINLVSGQPFNATVTSLADITNQAEDLTGLAVKGRYDLRLRWIDSSRPNRTREQVRSYTLT